MTSADRAATQIGPCLTEGHKYLCKHVGLVSTIPGLSTRYHSDRIYLRKCIWTWNTARGVASTAAEPCGCCRWWRPLTSDELVYPVGFHNPAPDITQSPSRAVG